MLWALMLHNLTSRWRSSASLLAVQGVSNNQLIRAVECKWITTHKKMLGEYVYFVCLKGNKKYHPTYRIFKSPDVCVDLKNPTLACLCFALCRLIEYFVCQMRFSEFWFIFMDHRVWIRSPPPSFLLSPSYSSVHQHPEEESLVKTILSSFNFFSF